MDVDRLAIMLLCVLVVSRRIRRLRPTLVRSLHDPLRRETSRVIQASGESGDSRQPSDASRLAGSVRPALVDFVEGRMRPWWPWALGGVLLVVVALVLDGLLGSSLGIKFDGGDVARELAALGQWGQLASLFIVGACLVSLQPARWRRLLDLALAAGVAALVLLLLKLMIGRVRPTHETPYVFDGWLLQVGDAAEGLSSYDLASMPSSHTSGAVVLSVFVALLWPRLGWLALAMAVLVAFSRVIFVAHWLGDVVVGAIVGFLVSYPIIRGFWGVRLLDAVWRSLVSRDAEPALPEVVAEEQRNLEKGA